MFFNGRMVADYTSNEPMAEVMGSDEVFNSSFLLGQESDRIGGDFDVNQMFQGELAELNFWNRILDGTTITAIANCKETTMKGNVISWAKSNFRFFGVKVDDKSDYASMCEATKTYLIFPQRNSFHKAKDLCSAHGGTLVAPKSDEDNSKIQNIVRKHEICINPKTANFPGSSGGHILWLGLERHNSTWYTGTNKLHKEKANYTHWRHGEMLKVIHL